MPDIIDATPESHRDLLITPLTATLTTVDPLGRAQSTAVWYLVEDGQLKSSTTSDRQKYKNLIGNPNCFSLRHRSRQSIPDPRGPCRSRADTGS
jgi:hypothetical protein